MKGYYYEKNIFKKFRPSRWTKIKCIIPMVRSAQTCAHRNDGFLGAHQTIFDGYSYTGYAWGYGLNWLPKVWLPM
jgi:hypothetical protein